jgi:hypothetical protein
VEEFACRSGTGASITRGAADSSGFVALAFEAGVSATADDRRIDIEVRRGALSMTMS